MRKGQTTRSISLHAVDQIANDTEAFLTQNGKTSHEITALRLTVEELLLNYQEALGDSGIVSISFEKKYHKLYIHLAIPGPAIDPGNWISDESRLLQYLAPQLGTLPTWRYVQGQNLISLSTDCPRTGHALLWILLSLLLGILLGTVANRVWGNDAIVFTESFLEPISNVFMGLLSSIATLMIFLSIITGITGMENINTLRTTGKRILSRCSITFLLCVMVSLAVLVAFFPLSRSNGVSLDLKASWNLLLHLIPDNVFRSFSTGNTLQIVFLGLICGVCLLVMGDKVATLRKVLYEANAVIMMLIRLLIGLIPLVVFINIFKISVHGNIQDLLQGFRYPVFMAILVVLLLFCQVVAFSLKQHVPVPKVIGMIKKTAVIALVTSSSTACFDTMINTLENDMGIPEEVSQVGIPLGINIMRPGYAIMLLTMCFSMGEIFQTPLAISQLLPLILSTVIMAISAPPVPGSSLAVVSILLNQMGIPAEALSIVVAMDFLIDRLGTTLNVISVQLELGKQKDHFQKSHS